MGNQRKALERQRKYHNASGVQKRIDKKRPARYEPLEVNWPLFDATSELRRGMETRHGGLVWLLS